MKVKPLPLSLRHASRLYHIGIGRTHTGTHILMLIQDQHIRIIDAATGELLRSLTLDPGRIYHESPWVSFPRALRGPAHLG